MKMLRLIMLTLMLCGMALNSHAQNVSEEIPKMKELKKKDLNGNLTPVRHKKGLWGFVNEKSKFVIKPEFHSAQKFEGNVARVCYNGKWGILGRNGLYVVKPTFIDSLYKFSADSVAIFEVNNRCGLIDSKGIVRQEAKYVKIESKSYGYLVLGDMMKYSTIDKNGQNIHEHYFDSVEPLNEATSLELFFMDGKWGLLKDGNEILAHGWDEKLQLLYDADGNSPDLYLITHCNLHGVVTSDGKQVLPIYYDTINLHESGKYFVTMRGGKYGAVSLKMSEIVPPILDEIPEVGKQIYRVYDGYTFRCANIDGSIEFRVCADVYRARHYDEYMATTDYPEWAKSDIIENNLNDYLDAQSRARTVIDVLNKHDYDMAYVRHENLPNDIKVEYDAYDVEKYGVITGIRFAEGYGNVKNLQIKMQDYNQSMCLASDAKGEKQYIIYNDKFSLLNDVLNKFNVKSCQALYLTDYAILPNGNLMVHVVFVKPEEDADESLIETDYYNLPVSNDVVRYYTGRPNVAMESHAVITFEPQNMTAISFMQIPAREGGFMISKFGGLYTHTSQSVVADANNSFSRYDYSGNLEWTFTPYSNEVLLDVDETESYIYLCGYLKNGNSERPLIIQLDKLGNRVEDIVKEDNNGRFSAIMCKDFLIYAKLDSVSDSYLPYVLLEDIGDNMYVRPSCVWEKWGGKMIGGCGLIVADGKWIHSPVLEGEYMSDDDFCGWEFGSFIGDYLIIRNGGRCGIINRQGEITVIPKYEQLEMLDNTNFFRFSRNGKFGVIDGLGNVIVPAEYDYIGRMSEDIIVAKKGRLYGCFDATGQEIVPFEFVEIKEYVGGMARISGSDGYYGFIDKNGSMLVRPDFETVEYYSEGLALISYDGKFLYVDLDGKWILRKFYDAGGSFSCGLAPVCIEGKWGYVDVKGKEVIDLKYDTAEDFNKAFKIARVSIDGKWGVINDKGVEIIPLLYDEIVICADGYLYVKLGDKSGVYAPNGDIVCPCEYDSIKGLYDSNSNMFKHGVAIVKVAGRSVRIDTFGNKISHYTYE